MRPGQVVVRGMLEQNPLVEFTGGDERLREWVKRQGEMPQVVFIEGGYVTPKELARSPIPRIAAVSCALAKAW